MKAALFLIMVLSAAGGAQARARAEALPASGAPEAEGSAGAGNDAAGAGEGEEAVVRFGSRFSAGLNSKYNFLMFHTGNITASSNTPVILGLSAGYRDYSLAVNIAQTYTYTQGPGTHPALDAELGFYQKYWFEELAFKFYDDFKLNDEPFGLRYISLNLSGRYVFNGDRFSLRAVFPMNRLQRRSAGSFIAGANIRMFTVQSDGIAHFNSRRWYVNTGPNAGYSYTFVTDGFFFINLYIYGGVNIGAEVTAPEFVFSLFTSPRITAGRHFKTWSFNFIMSVEYSLFVRAGRKYESCFYAAAAPGVSKRF